MMKRVVVMCLHLAVFSVTKAKKIDVSADVIADANALLQALTSSKESPLHGTRGAMSSSSLTGSSDVALDDYSEYGDADVVVEAPVLDYETAFETDRPVVATPPFRVLFRTSSMKFDIDGWSNGVELPTSYDCPPRIDRYATTRALRQTRSA